jgi:hypothetical protein
MGPNQANRLEEYKMSVKQVADPLDLSLLRFLKEFYETKSDDNAKLNDPQNVKQIFSIVLYEHCSSQADFIFGRSFFSQPLSQDRYGSRDLGLGKAVWREFSSCLVFTKGRNQLLMNLDGKLQ